MRFDLGLRTGLANANKKARSVWCHGLVLYVMLCLGGVTGPHNIALKNLNASTLSDVLHQYRVRS
jgi:hypothetical protein